MHLAGGRPAHPVALDAFAAAADDGWADPNRLHTEARRARLLLDTARQVLADALGTRTEEIRLTANHTSALHGAVAAVTTSRRRVGTQVVTSAVERAALLAAADHHGELHQVVVDGLGRVDIEAWREAFTGDVALAALQRANGEVGTMQPIAEAHRITRAAGVPLLVDAGAALGHVPIGDGWDLLAADPADWGGLPGVGVLAVRGQVRGAPPGPEDADPWAPGGVSVPAAVAAAASLRAVLAEQAASADRLRGLVDRIRAVMATVPDVEVVGDPQDRLPHVVTFSCLFADGETLVRELDSMGFAVGSGSACTSATLRPSHVLAAMGVLTHGNVRVWLPATVTDEAVDRFCAAVPEALARVRRLLGTEHL